MLELLSQRIVAHTAGLGRVGASKPSRAHPIWTGETHLGLIMEPTSKIAIDSQRESDMKSRAYLLSFPLFLLCLLPVAAAQTNQTPSSTQPTQAQTTQPTQTQASTPDSSQQQPAQQPVSTGQAPPPADTQLLRPRSRLPRVRPLRPRQLPKSMTAVSTTSMPSGTVRWAAAS